MSFEDFKTEYNDLLGKMMNYPLNQAGSLVYAEKLGELADAYPEHDELMDDE